ncbi:hypothetical protein JJC00_08245 [Bradyrhizobium diazoefficiens]|uniref:alpha/beta hydrolase family protein n=1 Tax=Bradyrhizobium diazoefficiens TaxID=1355477 RepID=UPI00190BB1E6|nr:hypothetical protein [Bradyrhizobium diazoefficiens]QQO35583.1 hypothetical protein JJC00_08245 [Bradyrhizobium diazoefficiens]
MLCAAWPRIRSDLASTRRGVELFVDNLEDIYEALGRQNWAAKWMNIGDVHYLQCDLELKRGAFAEAAEAWLCALTAFEVARRLVDEDDPQNEEILAKVEAGIRRFGLSLEHKVERVEIPCWDQSEFQAYYLPAGGRDLCVPAVICISREEETATTLLGRLLSAVRDRGISLLVVSHRDVANYWRGQSEELLSSCLEYLSLRPDVDASRIGIYGEGLSAALATDFAVSDRRVAAAVCDGGLWNWAWSEASVGWLTRTADVVDEDAASTRRSRLVQQLRCPVLVVAGGSSMVRATEAIEFQADCAAARVDLELAMPRVAQTPLGEIENFVVSDERIFRWLEDKLAHTSTS